MVKFPFWFCFGCCALLIFLISKLLNVIVSRYWMHLRQDNKGLAWNYSSFWLLLWYCRFCTQNRSIQGVIEILRHGKINRLFKSIRFHRSYVAGEGREIWIIFCSTLARNIKNLSLGWQQTSSYNKPEKNNNF